MILYNYYEKIWQEDYAMYSIYVNIRHYFYSAVLKIIKYFDIFLHSKNKIYILITFSSGYCIFQSDLHLSIIFMTVFVEE